MLKRVTPTDLRLLRVFHEVASLQGFTAAETSLGINQSTISNHIKALETRLGFQLCVRGRAGFRLTDAGEKLFQSSQTLERYLASFASAAAEIREHLAGHIKIGMPHILSRFPNLVGVPKAIARLREQSPDIQVEIHLDSQQEIENGVLDGRYDMAIGAIQMPPGRVDVIPLFSVPVNMYCSRLHPLFSCADDEITNERLRNEPCVMHHFDIEKQVPFQPGQAVSSRSTESSVFYILSGHYIGYLSEHVASPWKHAGELRAIRPDKYFYEAAGGIAIQKQRINSRLIKAVTDALVSAHLEYANPSFGDKAKGAR